MPRCTVFAPSMRDLPTLTGPLIYLDGPIQGVEDWQQEAIDILGDLAPDVHVASPRAKQFKGMQEAHLTWELAFSERAAREGVILFWLAREKQHHCSRTFAAQTRFNLGEWVVRSQLGIAKVVVGIERGFTGGPYLHRRFARSYPNVPVCRSLRQACAVAAELTQAPAPINAHALNELFVPNFSLG